MRLWSQPSRLRLLLCHFGDMVTKLLDCPAPLFPLVKMGVLTRPTSRGHCIKSFSPKLQSHALDATELWGIRVARVEIKDVRIPVQLQRSMAAEAEATREARAKVRATPVGTGG